ncbi:hypothetical protein MAR_016564 [Mya arenaria]|uniref:Uncharacterized protein n=1 Tax=Mya arenaria TaxID=6604 RepID=A0ABY7FKK5_MYAAR|nr:hypothetical protein MAR_016564 [Mya arenaria]
MLPALSELSVKIFVDHLTDGKWDNVTDQLKLKTASVQKHNKFAESVFGFLDQLLRKKNNVSVISSEAYIMFTANKTQEWLKNKDEASRKELIDYACKSVEKVRKNFKQRKQQNEQRQRELLAQSIERAEQEEARRVAKLEKFTDKILFYGLWQSEDSVDDNLSLINSKTEKIESLKAQLNIRRYILAQKPNKTDEYKDIYSFSKLVNGQRKPLSVEELVIQVKRLVRHAYSVERKSADNNNNNNMPLLKGKAIEHKFMVDGEETWYNGTVPGFPDWYNVFYANDAAIYSYKLLKDYQEGNLKIVVN